MADAMVGTGELEACAESCPPEAFAAGEFLVSCAYARAPDRNAVSRKKIWMCFMGLGSSGQSTKELVRVISKKRDESD
jgi:hypothetical protein